MTREEFLPMMEDLCEYHNKTVSDAVIEFWYQQVKYRTLFDVKQGFDGAKRFHRAGLMPSLEEFLTHIPKKQYYGSGPSESDVPIVVTEADRAFNLDCLPGFRKFLAAMVSGSASNKADARAEWHMHFKGVCLKHKRFDLYDEAFWTSFQQGSVKA